MFNMGGNTGPLLAQRHQKALFFQSVEMNVRQILSDSQVLTFAPRMTLV